MVAGRKEERKNKIVFTYSNQITILEGLQIIVPSVRVVRHWKVYLVFRNSQKSLKHILLFKVKQMNSF